MVSKPLVGRFLALWIDTFRLEAWRYLVPIEVFEVLE